jgi:N-acetylmuramoyl-L-alanine amidase
MKTSTKILWVHIISILVITVALLILISVSDFFPPFFTGFVIIGALGVIYGVITKYINAEITGKTQGANPYHRFFFGGTGLLTTVLTVLGLLSALFVYLEHGNLFQALGLVVSVIWVAVFLRYFMWSVYHYNINYGLTDKDWEKIFEAREKEKMGFPVNEKDLEAPEVNPYRSQTFGLPPGTVRGMIAFTILFGGLSLLIVSFGTEYSTSNQLAVIRQQFEFFETAFLMMIAFYFGDKSLKYLQKRWTRPGTTEAAPGAAPGREVTNDLEDDDLEFVEDEREFAQMEDEKSPPPLTQLRKALSTAALKPQPTEVIGSFVQIKDNIYSKVLSDEEIEKALAYLREEEQIELTYPVVKAIIEVESSGRGHLPDGKPKILFEGHKFWYWLEKLGKDPQALQEEHPNVIYKTWTSKYYLGGINEYKRLEAARQIDEKAAIYSASWGLFQMLGENLEHNLKSRLSESKVASGNKYYYKDYKDFEEKQGLSEYYHFLDFLEFIKVKTAKGKRLIEYIHGHNDNNYDWATFAYGYNGSGYKENKYDVKLKAAYQKHRITTITVETDKITPTGFIPIIDAGHGGMKDGQYTTDPKTGKKYKFSDGVEIFEGDINRKIGRILIDLLQEAGIPYHNLTVGTLEDTSLKERVTKANEIYAANKNCYFLSIHSNCSSTALTGDGGTATGFEVWTSVGQTKSDELASITAKWYKHDFPGFKFRQDMTDGDDDQEKNYYVLKNTHCPAFLVENLFYDNKQDAQFLLSTQGQTRVARCLFNTVKEIYYNYKV